MMSGHLSLGEMDLAAKFTQSAAIGAASASARYGLDVDVYIPVADQCARNTANHYDS
jgi:hypothetical protein